MKNPSLPVRIPALIHLPQKRRSKADLPFEAQGIDQRIFGPQRRSPRSGDFKYVWRDVPSPALPGVGSRLWRALAPRRTAV